MWLMSRNGSFKCAFIVVIVELLVVAALRQQQPWKNDLLTRSTVSESEQFQYLKKGHIFCKGLFDSSVVKNELQPLFADIFQTKELESWQHLTRVVCNDMETNPSTVEECKLIIADNSESDGVPFLQLFHLWKTNKMVKQIACSPALGKIAAEIMGVNSVRLYQDSLFVKNPGHGSTDWHFDMNMVPLDTNDYITCWIPMQPIPLTHSQLKPVGNGLHYASGSHRDVAIHYWYESGGVDFLKRFPIEDHGAYELGDCSFHSGWCLHGAPKNSMDIPRLAYTVSFVADGVKTLNDKFATRYPDDEDYHSYSSWIEEVGWNRVVRSTNLPRVYTSPSTTKSRSSKSKQQPVV